MKERIKKLIALAEKYLGRPYKYGAKPSDAPKFFDCSSFMQYLYKQVGIKIPRTALEQIDVGGKVDKKNLQAGDLIFCKGTTGRYNSKHPDGVGHVAIYIGRGKIIQAKSVEKNGKEIGAVVKQDIANFFKNGWRGARRLL